MEEDSVLDGWMDDEDWITINSVQHYVYCPRQWALIEREQVWDENVFTSRGSMVHEQVDRPSSTTEGEVRIETSLPLWSVRYHLTGKADKVEFYPDRIVPVETKHGPRRSRLADDLQVIAQAVCLEEMFGLPVPLGSIYHHSSRKRRDIPVTENLKQVLKEMLLEIRSWRHKQELPHPPADSRCHRCSLLFSCQPRILDEKGLASWTRQEERLYDILPGEDV